MFYSLHLHFTFKSFIRFELVFVSCSLPKFLFFCMWMSNCSITICWKDPPVFIKLPLLLVKDQLAVSQASPHQASSNPSTAVKCPYWAPAPVSAPAKQWFSASISSPVIRSAFCLWPQYSDICKKNFLVYLAFFLVSSPWVMASKLLTCWPGNGNLHLSSLFFNTSLFHISLSLEKVMIFSLRGERNCH